MRIAELHLPAPDLEPMRRFYAGMFGFPEEPSDGGNLVLKAGASLLVFTGAPAQDAYPYHFAFNIPENRSDEAKEWVSGMVPLITSTAGDDRFHFGGWNADAFYFYDPAGNILEFIARHDLPPREDTGPFGGQSVLSISEVGLATDDVPATVRMLQDRLAVEVYDGAGSDTFTAVGDVHGLFIVVKRGRTWFPDTGVPAELLPLEVIVAVGGMRRYVLSGPPYEITAL